MEKYTLLYQEIDPELPLREGERQACGILARKLAGENAVIEHYDDGAPYIPGYEGLVSLSHCRGLAVMAASESAEIGVDAEVWREQLRRVVNKFLAPEEMETWSATNEALLRAWTIKEAVYKAARTPGLPLCDIRLPRTADGSIAATPDGRQWQLDTTTIEDATVTVSIARD